MGKRKGGKSSGAISKGERPNVNKKILNAMRRDKDGLTTLRQLPINKNHPTKEEYNKYFTHNRWQDVQLLSIKEIFQWQKGYAVKWDRSEYHTSDNFLQNELNDKIALVMFNERV